MPRVRALNEFYNTRGSLKDFVLESFSDDRETFEMPEENRFSCSHYEKSCFDFLMKYKANHRIDPKTFEKGVEGILMPETDSKDSPLTYDDESPGESKYFDIIKKDHCDYIAKDETEVWDIAELIYNKKQFAEFTHKQFDDYLLSSVDDPEWNTYLRSKDGKKWRRYVVQILKNKLMHDFSFKFEKESLLSTYKKQGQIFRDGLLKISSLSKFVSLEKNELYKAFGQDSDFSELFKK